MSLNLETVRFVKCYLWLVEYNDAGTLKRTLNDQNSVTIVPAVSVFLLLIGIEIMQYPASMCILMPTFIVSLTFLRFINEQLNV